MSTSLSFAKQWFHPNTIPTDAILQILARCDTASILAVRGVSKHFRHLIDSTERPLVGGIIRDQYAPQADLFERMGRDTWDRMYNDKEMELSRLPTFSKLSLEYLWIVEARNNYLFKPLVESIEELGIRWSQAHEMATVALELNTISNWPRNKSVFATLASWPASKITKVEESFKELAENAKCIKSWLSLQDIVNPHETMPQEYYLPRSVTEDELDSYGLPAIYNMYCIMGRSWPHENIFLLADILHGHWLSYDYDLQCCWFNDMAVWVEYSEGHDEWGTLYVRFTDARYDPLKLFVALKNVPEGGTLSPTWWQDVWDEPSANFERSAFWNTPNTIWNWKGGSYGLEKLFHNPWDLGIYGTGINDTGFVSWDISDVDDADLWPPITEDSGELEEEQETENPGEDQDAENVVVRSPAISR